MSSRKLDLEGRLLLIILSLLTVSMVVITSVVYLRETSAFRFFDEENNIVAGYFMSTGKLLYRDIFMNHNPLPILLSAIIQRIFVIQTLFELVKYHRLFMICFALAANTILLVRFRQKAFVFIFVYEFIKFYLAGQMFLAEGMIAYAFAYLILTLTEARLQNKKIGTFDLIFSTALFVFIVLSREPYVPVACVLFGLVLYFSHSRRLSMWCGIAATCIIVLFMVQFDMSEFYKQVILLNQSLAKGDLKDQNNAQLFSGLSQIYQYVLVGIQLDKPVYIILGAMSITLIFLTYRITRVFTARKRILFVLLVLSVLFLAGIRNYKAGSEWYGMYRSIPYIAIVLSFISGVVSVRFATVAMIFVLGILLIHPRSHLREKRINADEYYIQYSRSNQSAQVINLLCSKYPLPCTLHIDDIDVYPYWITKKPPVYRYTFYYPVNKAYLDYKQIREQELVRNPPVIYYDGSCMVDPTYLPQSLIPSFIFLTQISTETKKEKQDCIAVHRKLLPYIDDDIRSAIASHGKRLDTQ